MALATADPRSKLREVEAAISEKRDELSGALTERDTARDAVLSADGVASRESDEYKAAEAAVGKVSTLREDLDSLQEQQVTYLKLLGQEPDASPGRQVEGGMGDTDGWNSAKLESADLEATLEHISATKSKFGTYSLGEIASKEALVADVTGTANMRRGPYRGILPQLRRRIRLLDLIPTGTMTGNTIPYTVESGNFTTSTAPVEVAEGAVKPESGMTLTDATASAATIAHWMKIQKQSLSDWPALRSIVDSRLRYGLLRRVEAEVLAGDGTGQNMTGILNTSGIGSVSYTAGAAVSEQILRAITSIYLADAEATAAVVHPTDWQRALLQKAQYPAAGTPTVGSLEYTGGGPFATTPESMWGIPLIPTAAVP
jgi:HK97 family phage major capsid protein